MGCGASSATSANAPTAAAAKDVEDFSLEPVMFAHFGVSKFDRFCKKLAKPVNSVVNITNDINEAINEIKDACALVTKSYRVQVTLGKDRTRVVLSLAKADGSVPTPDEVSAVVASAQAADTKLHTALKTLDKALVKKSIALKVTSDLLSVDAPAVLPKEASDFNTALTALRGAVGATLKVSVTVVAAGAVGAKTASADMVLPTFKQPKSTKWDPEPVSLLSVAKTSQAKAIVAAELHVAKASAELAKATKAMPDTQYKLTLKGKRLVVTFPGPKGQAKLEAKADAKKAARKAAGKPEEPQEGEEDEEEAEEAEEEQEEEDEEPEEAAEDEGESSAGAVAEGEEPEDEGEADKEPDAEAEEEAAAAEGEGAEGETPAEEEPAAAEEAAGDEEGGEAAAASKAGGAKAQTAPVKKSLPDPLAEKKAALTKAVGMFNSQVFKLSKACTAVQGPTSIGKAFLCIIEDIKKEVLAATNKAEASVMQLIKLDPKVTFVDGALDFAFDLAIDVDGFQGLGMDGVVKKLSGPVQLVWAAVLHFKTMVTKTLPQFQALSAQVTDLVASIDTVFASPLDSIKESMGDSVNPMEVMRMGKAVGTNLVKMKDCGNTVMVFMQTLQRAHGELSAAFTDLSASLKPVAAA